MARGATLKDIRRATEKQVARAIQPQALSRARAAFERIKREILGEFNSHPITVEIESGPLGANISVTLQGQGNLFSFIGFESGSRPTSAIRALIRKSYVSAGAPVGKHIYLNFHLPTKDEIYLSTPLPWAAGRSWVQGVETGMSGLGQYAYSRKGVSTSRSGTGTQTKNNIRTATYSPRPYVTQIIANATKRLERIIL